MMSRKEAFMHPIETIRTAPYGSAAVIFQSFMGSAAIYEFDHFDSPFAKAAALGMIAISALGGTMGAKLVGEQLELKERLEGIMDRRGYNDRIMAERTDEWCDRQTARVVCEKYDVLDQYEQLCEERKESAKFSWVPHI
jgi:hypothetical protein